jgi:hypothetical protein
VNRKLRVRQSQTVVPFGVGAVIDLQGESFVAAGTEHWPQPKEANEVESPRLARSLGVARLFAAPPTVNELFDSDRAPGPAYIRFPAWLFCRACRRMVRWSVLNETAGEPPKCRVCPQQSVLSPMRWVQICPEGHLGDVDWRWWGHWDETTGSMRQCTVKNGPISFTVTEGKFGLEALDIVCNAIGCPARRNLLKILGPSGMRCSGRNPWEREKVDCDKRTLVVQRTAGNLYYPIVHSALDIPEDAGRDLTADPFTMKVREHDLWVTLCAMNNPAGIAALRSMLSALTGASESLIDALLIEERGELTGAPGIRRQPDVPTDYSREEWSAFTSHKPKQSRTFETEPTTLGLADEQAPMWRELDSRVDQVVLGKRLREVRALAGFRRCSPESRPVPVNSAHRSTWLPAVEVFGEGVFLSLDERLLAEWEHDPEVRERVDSMNGDLEASFQSERLRAATGPSLLPRFVLLHTLAHLLIRTLSFESGYTTASLRERVYGRGAGDQHGLLVYTAAGDSEGTLGGLVRQGEPPRLAETLLRTIEAAAWCSSDPLCLEHAGQGFERLNRAACHACVLLPETSCETGNTLLDRSLLIGGNGVPGFFEHFADLARDAAAAAAERS